MRHVHMVSQVIPSLVLPTSGPILRQLEEVGTPFGALSVSLSTAACAAGVRVFSVPCDAPAYNVMSQFIVHFPVG